MSERCYIGQKLAGLAPDACIMLSLLERLLERPASPYRKAHINVYGMCAEMPAAYHGLVHGRAYAYACGPAWS